MEESKLGVPGLSLYPGSFKEAQRAATHQAKYFLVYLHAPDHPDAADFLNDVLGNIEIQALLKQRCVCWAQDINTSEGYELSLVFAATTFPFVAVGIKMQWIFTIQGQMNAAEFGGELKRAMENGMPLLAQEVAFAYERDQRELLRQQQEAALLAAEAEDARREEQRRIKLKQEKEKAAAEEAGRKAVERKLREEEETKRRQQEEEEARAQAIENQRALAVSSIPSPPPEDASPDEIAQIRLMTVAGHPINLRLWRTDPVRVLYAIVRSHDDFDGHEIELSSGFPPKVIPESDAAVKDFPMLLPRSAVNTRRV